MKQEEKLTGLRNYLKKNNFSAIIIPSNDPHFGEYIPDHYKVRGWLSGFDGSAGTLVVTLRNSALWTDSRYFVQAARQLDGSEIKLMKIKTPGTPSISAWLLQELGKTGTVIVDEDLFTYNEYLHLKEELSPLTLTPVPDPFDEIWPDRPEIEFRPISYFDDKYSGESVESKHKMIVNKLNFREPFALIVSTCDDVASLFNIRGNDIEYNPLPLCYAVVTNSSLHLFCDLRSLSGEASKYLKSQGVLLYEYREFTPFLKGISGRFTIIFSSDKVTVKNYLAVTERSDKVIKDPTIGGTIPILKAIKNSVELAGFRQAFLNDGVAWVNLLHYIDTYKGVLDEYSISRQLIRFRSECDDYQGESFSPIVAFGPNAALPHYHTAENTSEKIGKDGFLLIDTGAQYLYGTTDTTRTLPLGELTQEQKNDYTLVLKGMIDLTMAQFPKNTRGSQLDILARGPIMSKGKMYFHGTGHGIGHYLCVHEGPQSIRMEENPVALEIGMVLSNEPGFYLEGKYGIRIENIISVKHAQTTSFGEFYAFETMTIVPIDLSVINPELLTSRELEWVTTYNNRVYHELAQYLDQDVKNWLKQKYLKSI